MNKTIYRFLFIDHDVATYRICYAMLLPCALSDMFRCIWMWVMVWAMTVVMQGKTKGWDRYDD